MDILMAIVTIIITMIFIINICGIFALDHEKIIKYHPELIMWLPTIWAHCVCVKIREWVEGLKCAQNLVTIKRRIIFGLVCLLWTLIFILILVPFLLLPCIVFNCLFFNVIGVIHWVVTGKRFSDYYWMNI